MSPSAIISIDVLDVQVTILRLFGPYKCLIDLFRTEFLIREHPLYIRSGFVNEV